MRESLLAVQYSFIFLVIEILIFCKVGGFLIVNFDLEQAMVDVAKACGADAVSHGCTGKGNDQVLCLINLIRLHL